MRVDLDTNVVLSGVFFAGVPGEVLSAWSAGRFDVIVSGDRHLLGIIGRNGVRVLTPRRFVDELIGR